MAATDPPTDPGESPPPLPVTDDGPTIKMDLLGSTQTLGVASRDFDRAVRRGIATGIPDSATNRQLGLAINRAIEQQGLFHHWITNLPLQQVRATKFGKDQAWLSFQYARSRYTEPTQHPREVATFRTAYEHVQAYKDIEDDTGSRQAFVDGMPNGKMHGLSPREAKNDRKEPTGYRMRRPVVRISVTAYLYFNPFSQVGGAINKVNPTPLTFGGFTFESGVLRFDGLDTDWVERQDKPTKPVFVTDYSFTAAEFGHFRQEPIWDSVAKAWDAHNVVPYEPWEPGTVFPQ